MTSKKTKMEPAKDTAWLIYVEPHEFSIQYPSYWKFEGGGKSYGTEIVRARKHDHFPCKNETCAMCPNSAFVALSIYSKESKTLREIANQSVGYYDVWEFKIDTILLSGQQAIRIHAIEDGYPAIKTFFEYPGSQYACLYGRYSRGIDSTQMSRDLEKIQNSFKILK